MSAGKDAAKGAAKKRGLGRGLEALLGPKAAAEAPPLQAMPGDTLRTLPVDAMVPGKFQPRRTMDDARLEELASSIRAQGVIQPIVVREQRGADGKGGRTYEIIAGERRWRASQRAGLGEDEEERRQGHGRGDGRCSSGRASGRRPGGSNPQRHAPPGATCHRQHRQPGDGQHEQFVHSHR